MLQHKIKFKTLKIFLKNKSVFRKTNKQTKKKTLKQTATYNFIYVVCATDSSLIHFILMTL